MDDEDVEFDAQVAANFLTAVKYNEEDWQSFVQKVAQRTGWSLEKTQIALEIIHNYLLELTQTN